MKESLLNENQARRIATHLQLMNEQLTALARLPELAREGRPFDAVRALIARVAAASDTLRETLGLGTVAVPDFRRRVSAVAEIWAVRMEDLAAARLKGYGAVHPDLASPLDGGITELTSLLAQLSEAAGRLPLPEH